MAVPAELLEIIVCPQCHGPLSLETDQVDQSQRLTSQCGLVFGVVDDIPVLLVDEALDR